ncbi:MAG TPA: GNAT family N-acetyltransferase [Polyangiaceae bacterium]|nr:GNAT family N-acetyltransferase [Polyangiaceae bacterium]
MPDARPYRVERAAPQHGAALATLLSTNGFGCYCRYWHFAGNHREWLARCAHTPDDNRTDLLAAFEAGSSEASGMVAMSEHGDALGWLKLAPAIDMTKLYDQRLYKGLPCLQRDPLGVWTVGCLFVRESHRRQGVATALLAGAIGSAASQGARAIEAFPRSDVDVADAALMMGPLALFVRAGFEVVHDFTPYPVLRLELGRKAAA